MTLPIKALTATSLLFLSHAIYSAYEHSLLSQHKHGHHQTIRMPTDIVLETLVSTGVLLVVVVFSSAPFRPINWAEWAGKIEREGWDPNAPVEEGENWNVVHKEGVGRSSKGGHGNPYKALEERRGFLDIRAQRKEFADWVRNCGGVDIKQKGN